MNDYNFVDNRTFLNKMSQDDGFFMGRISGSDYTPVFEYCFLKLDIEDIYRIHYDFVRNFNGYFDKETDEIKKIDNFKNYLEIMFTCYKECEILSNPCREIQINLENHKNNFNKLICSNKPILHYSYIESVSPFLNDFKIFAENKKVLIVSPFSESIKFQYHRKDFILKDYIFPNFELITYDTPVTYNNDNDTLNHIESDNWIEQCQKMEDDIMKLNFDIALLSCGSYAMYLGNAISKKMNKKAIYIGGVLNVMFNIRGKRYEGDVNYNNIKNLEYEIVALEKAKKCDILFGGKSYNSESLLAYF
jgi:hypothetical protein